MICDSCGRDSPEGYYREIHEGKQAHTVHICRKCLLDFDRFRRMRKPKNKYDHAEIYRMHKRGASSKAIAEHLGTNTMVVDRAIREGMRADGKLEMFQVR